MTIILKNIVKALLWGGIYLSAQFIGTIICFIVMLFTEKDKAAMFLNGNIDNISTDEILSSLAIPTLILAATLIIIISLIIFGIKKNTNKVFAKINIKKIFLYVLLGMALNFAIGIILAFVPVSNYTADLEESVSYALTGSFIPLIIGTGILVPISEEIIFRYGIGYNLSKINVAFGIVTSALIFGIAHGNLIQAAYAFVYGIVFGICDFKEKSLWPSIIMHIAINTTSVIISFL